MKKKVIHIVGSNKNIVFDKTDSYYYAQGWARQLCEFTVKYSNDYQLEIWRPDFNVEKTETKEVGGFIARLFPFRRIINEDFCPQILLALEEEISKNQVLIHTHEVHKLLYYSIIRMFPKVPIIIHHHGNDPPLLYYDFNSYGSFYKKITRFPYLLFKRYLDIRYSNNTDFLLTSGIGEAYYFKHFLRYKGTVAIFKGGTDFEKMRLIKKEVARKILGISLDKKVLVTIGRTTKIKGVDNGIEFANRIKNKKNVMFVWIGEKVNRDGYYEKLIEQNVMCPGRLDLEKICLYLNSADLYATFGTSPSLTDIGGINTATIEALACNTPVVSMKLRNYKNPKEIRNLGIYAKNKHELFEGINHLLHSPPKNFNSRKYVIKNYDWNSTIKRLLTIYHNLFTNYYEFEI